MYQIYHCKLHLCCRRMILELHNMFQFSERKKIKSFKYPVEDLWILFIQLFFWLQPLKPPEQEFFLEKQKSKAHFQTPCNKILILTFNGCFLKILANFSKGDIMNSRAINPVKMSFVNFVKCFTNTDPWNAATTSDTTINQIPTHTRHAKKSMPLPFEKRNIKIQILFS